MDRDTITLVISISSVLVSVAVFTIAYSQMKIASAKAKLELYNRRFDIYLSALNYYHSIYNDSYDKMKEKSFIFNKSYRESLFLFDSKDQVYEILGKIQDNGATICGYEEHRDKINNQSTTADDDLRAFSTRAMTAREEFQTNLLELEKNISKYLQFKNINGWDFF